MKVNKKVLRRMILSEMGRLPTGGRRSQRGELSARRRGGRGEMADPHLDFSQLAEADDEDTLSDDLADAEADLDAAGGALTDIEDNAMVAIKAIYDLAAAAGVDLEVDASGPGDDEVDVDIEDVEDVDVEEEVLQERSRRRARKILLRKVNRELKSQ